jgi:Tannase and feruloyl esterase
MILTGPESLNASGQTWGLHPGTDFLGLANTVTRFGVTRGVPFPVADTFIKFFLEENAEYNTSSITYDKFNQLFAQANEEYNSVIGINDPDLSAFRDAGGKMITWHGMADNLVSSEGTIKYYQEVENTVGQDVTPDFYRLFLAPGAGHCYSQNGPIPTDVLAPLVDWVESGVAPETLAAQLVGPGNVDVTSNICLYPLVQRYDGEGDPNSASSYTCATSFS